MISYFPFRFPVDGFPSTILLLAALLPVLGISPLHAQSVEQVTTLGSDDQIGTFGTFTEQFVATDQVLYFPVEEGGTGEELYVYDGSSVDRITDLPEFTGPKWPTVYDENLYFTNDGSEGNELYGFDGSSVQRITNVNTSGGSGITQSVVYDGRLFFRADPDGDFGNGDLYVYDGSSVTRITDTGGTLNPTNFVVYDDGNGAALYFNGTSSSAGDEIFRYDGSDASLAVDVNEGADSSTPTAFETYDGSLYFQAGTGSDGFTNRELYRTDGSAAARVEDINTSGPSRPRNLTVYDGGSGAELYFTAEDGDDTELYRSDGAGVTKIDLDDDPTSSSSPDDLVSAGGVLYLSATLSGENNLYQYDASSGSVSQVADVNSSGGSKPYGLVVFNNVLYFTADDGDNFELYRTTFPVPVELASFEGTQSGESEVRLTWKTASEQNNVGFRIQHRRANGTEAWSGVGFVDGHGTTSQPQSYTYTVRDLRAGTHRFRLVQVDLDGTTHQHDPVAVDLQMQQPVRLSTPESNPVQDEARLDFEVREAQSVAIRVFNALGQKVETLYRGWAAANQAKSVTLSTDELASGTYFVRIKAGPSTKTRRVTVVR